MAVSSTMLPLGTQAPEFSVPSVNTDHIVRLATFEGKKALLVMFICRHCPYVQHIKKELAKIGTDYKNKDIGIVAISSNDPSTHPEDAPGSLAEFAQEEGFTFPLCFDRSQRAAKAFNASCTPDFFLYDDNRQLVYRGQLDDTRPGSGEANGKDLRAAIDAVLTSQAVSPDQKPSVGCGIKWRPGNEPGAQETEAIL